MTVSHRRAIAALLAATLFVAVVVFAPDAQSAGGGLDTTFNTTGSTALDFDNGTDAINDIALQSDGKIVVVGATGSGFGLARYTTTGALDTTFSGDGKLTSAVMTHARGVALQTDGKILVVGRSVDTNGSLVIARYTATGVPDSTFDADGTVSVAMTGTGSGGYDVVVQSDGRIVALALDAGALSVFRYTAAGVLDTTWGGDGRVDTTSPSSFLNRLAVLTDFRVVLTAGTAGVAGGLLRFNADGTPDTTFDADGIATTTDHVANALVVQSDGKVVYAGDQGSAGTGVLVARRGTDGALDTAYGTAGVTTFAVPGLTSATVWGAALQSDGKVVVTGRVDDASVTSTVFVARLTTAGALDTTFATNGIALFSSIGGRSTSGAHAVAVDSTGRYVVGGALVGTSGLPSDTDFQVFRVASTDTTTSTSSTSSTSSTTTTTVPGFTVAGGTARSDPANTTPSASNRVVVALDTPVAGRVTFTKDAGDPVDGARVVAGVQIVAPTATVVQPLRVAFDLDMSTVPSTFPLGGIQLLRDGDVVDDCIGATTATPDPCIASRSRSGDVLTITTLTSKASHWQMVEPIIQRIAGASRIESAVAASRSSFATGGASAVVVARADGFADALAATPLAVAKNGPLLLSQTGDLDDATLSEITRVLAPGGTVYLLGGTGALSVAVDLRLVSWGYVVERLAGANRYETAEVVARVGLDSPNVVVETTGLGFADALAAGAVAARLGGAVLLTAGSDQSAATLAYINEVEPTRYAIGGPAALADAEALAVFGGDRYETAVLAARVFFPESALVGLASGAAFPDALAGGAHAALAGAPLLLVPPDGPMPVSLEILFRELGADRDPPKAFLYGGTGAVSNAIASDLLLSLGG